MLTAIVISMAVTLYLVATLGRRVEIDGELEVVPPPDGDDSGESDGEAAGVGR